MLRAFLFRREVRTWGPATLDLRWAEKPLDELSREDAARTTAIPTTGRGVLQCPLTP